MWAISWRLVAIRGTGGVAVVVLVGVGTIGAVGAGTSPPVSDVVVAEAVVVVEVDVVIAVVYCHARDDVSLPYAAGAVSPNIGH